jgi:hypothetical protein
MLEELFPERPSEIARAKIVIETIASEAVSIAFFEACDIDESKRLAVLGKASERFSSQLVGASTIRATRLLEALTAIEKTSRYSANDRVERLSEKLRRIAWLDSPRRKRAPRGTKTRIRHVLELWDTRGGKQDNAKWQAVRVLLASFGFPIQSVDALRKTWQRGRKGGALRITG